MPNILVIMDQISETFRARRIALGLGQAQAAKAAGVSRNTLAGFETGATGISLSNLRRLLGVVGLELVTREAARRPTLDEIPERYGGSDAAPSRKRASKKRKRP